MDWRSCETAPKTITSDEGLPDTYSRPASTFSPKPAQGLKIVFKLDSPAARGLYLSVGFEPVKQTAILSRRASARAS